MHEPDEVELTWSEVASAAYLGIWRRITSRRNDELRAARGDRGSYQSGFRKNGWEIDVMGAIAELVVAKHLGVYWEPKNETYKDPDVGTNWQVRWRDTEEGRVTRELIVREDDPDDHRYILVTGNNRHYKIHGWILGADAKVGPQQNHGGYGSAWFVPSSQLKPLNRSDLGKR